MKSQSNTFPEPGVHTQGAAPAVMPATRPLYWSVRRELWENRSIYLVPAGAAAVSLFGFFINTAMLRRHMHSVWNLDPEQQRHALAAPYQTAAFLIMGSAFLVGIFYSIDALYGERRDRSILFWKSLPVSDLTTVLSKITIPIVILPLLSFAIAVITQWLMLLLSSVMLLGSGLSLPALWTQSSFFHMSLMLLYHMVTVHGLWYAPFYAWLLLVSAWAPRAPFLWAFLPPFVIAAVEKMTFNTTYFLDILKSRLAGPEPSTRGSTMMDALAAMGPVQFFSTPGLWIGLALAAAFLAAAVWLRRYRGPI
jgi:ABC-2 type transport system permease protein